MANDLFKDHMLAMVTLGQHCLALELLARRLEPEHWARLIDETLAEVRTEFDGMSPQRLQEFTARALRAVLRGNGVDGELLPLIDLQQRANESGESIQVTRFDFGNDLQRKGADTEWARTMQISSKGAPPLEKTEYTITPQIGIAETPEGAEAARIEPAQEQEF